MSLNYRQTRKAIKRYHIGEIRDQPLKILIVKLEHHCKPQTLYKQVDLDGVVVFSCLSSWQKYKHRNIQNCGKAQNSGDDL